MIEALTVQELSDEGLIRALNIIVAFVEVNPDNDMMFDRLVRFETEADARGIL